MSSACRAAQSWNFCNKGTDVTFRGSVYLVTLALVEDVMKTGLKQVAALFAQEAKAPLITIPEGTQITARLTDSLNSGQVHVGDAVALTVLEDLKIQNAVAVPRGAIVLGHVTQAKGARKMGRGGKIEISFEPVTAADGTKVPVSGERTAKGKGGYGAGSATGAVAAGLFFPPAGALLLLKHGHASVIDAGTVVTVHVTADTRVAAAPIVAAVVPVQVVQSQCRDLVRGENNFLASDETYVLKHDGTAQACRQVKVTASR